MLVTNAQSIAIREYSIFVVQHVLATKHSSLKNIQEGSTFRIQTFTESHKQLRIVSMLDNNTPSLTSMQNTTTQQYVNIAQEPHASKRERPEDGEMER